MDREQSEEALQEALKDLRDEMEKSPCSDEEAKRRLDAIREHLEEYVALPDEEVAESHLSLKDRLEEAVVHFEGTHPDLTVALNRVVDALSSLGI